MFFVQFYTHTRTHWYAQLIHRQSKRKWDELNMNNMLLFVFSLPVTGTNVKYATTRIQWQHKQQQQRVTCNSSLLSISCRIQLNLFWWTTFLPPIDPSFSSAPLDNYVDTYVCVSYVCAVTMNWIELNGLECACAVVTHCVTIVTWNNIDTLLLLLLLLLALLMRPLPLPLQSHKWMDGENGNSWKKGGQDKKKTILWMKSY